MRSRDGGKTWGGVTRRQHPAARSARRRSSPGSAATSRSAPRARSTRRGTTTSSTRSCSPSRPTAANCGRWRSRSRASPGSTGRSPVSPSATSRCRPPPSTPMARSTSQRRRSTRRAPAARQPARRSATRSSPASCRSRSSGDARDQGRQQHRGQGLQGRRRWARADVGSDIVVFKSTTAVAPPEARARQPGRRQRRRRPVPAVDGGTPSGQVNISFFDRRNDPANYFIDT